MMMTTAMKPYQAGARLLKRLALATLLALPGLASATAITSLKSGVVAEMPAMSYTGVYQGPQSFHGVTWSSTSNDSVFGYVGYTGAFYGFGDNGNWDDRLGPMAGLNSGDGTMTFEFAAPVSGVGGFLNWDPSYASSNPASIAVYDTKGHLIESQSVSFWTDKTTNSGRFMGFMEDKPIISKFTLTNASIGIVNLKTVPVPMSGWLFGSALIGLAAFSRRQTASSVA